MFRFANEIYLYALIIIPVLIGIFIIIGIIKRRALRRFGDLTLISNLMPEKSGVRPVIKFILLVLALTCIIIAVARPQFGSQIKDVKRKGVELVIALDVSNSMLSRDIKPNRLGQAKRSIIKMVEKLQNDKVGLIVFAGEAYVQIPLTTDYAATKMFMKTVSPQTMPRQGTAIGDALSLGMNSFDPDSDLNKAIVLITDGENHQGNAIDAAKKAANKGIRIYALGMGTTEGAPIPKPGSNGFLKDRQGNTVISKLHESLLQNIVSKTEGAYVRATNAGSGLDALYDEIEEMEKKKIESQKYSEYNDQFPVLIGLALFLLLIEFVILERKNRKLSGLRIFSTD